MQGGGGRPDSEASERLAETVLSICPRWIIFVEGVGSITHSFTALVG